MGDINSSHCYDLCEVEFACCDGSGGVSLTNITTINGMPPEGGFPTTPGAPFNSVQFNNAGSFGGSGNLTWDNVNHILDVTGAVGINTSPAFSLDVNGQVNSTGCYLINAVPFACPDASGGIDLTNITNINGSAYPPSVSGTPPAGIDRDIQFNNNGAFGASNTFVYTAAGNLGVGVNNPEVSIQTNGGILTTGVPTTWPDVGPGLMFFSDPVDGGAIYSYNFGPNTPMDLSLYARNFFVNTTTTQISGKVGIGKAPGANYALDVNGNVTTNGCYYILDIPWACLDSAGTGIDLTNINNINGSPYPPPSSGGSTVTVSDTPPANPNQGNLWFDSGDTQLYIWYQDPNSGQWVPTINQCSGGGGGVTNPAPPNMSVQWNNGGVFGGSGLLIWNNANTQLGVGTGTPAYTLDVVGALGIPTEYTARVMSTDTFCGLIIENSGAQGSGGESIISFRSQGVETAVISYDDDEDALIFWTGGRDAGESTLCCSTDPFVGVLTTSPACELDVNGMIRSISYSVTPTFGSGLELFYYPPSGICIIQAYNRDASTTIPLAFTASEISVYSNIGIGEAPQCSLDTVGMIRSTGLGNIPTSGTGPEIFYQPGVGSVVQGFSRSTPGGPVPLIVVGAPLELNPNGGNVGIGTSTPSALLSMGPGLAPVKVASYDGGVSNCYGIGVSVAHLTFGAGIDPNSGVPQMTLDTTGILNVTGGYQVNGTPHMLITQAMWDALTTRIQTLEARLAS